ELVDRLHDERFVLRHFGDGVGRGGIPAAGVPRDVLVRAVYVGTVGIRVVDVVGFIHGLAHAVEQVAEGVGAHASGNAIGRPERYSRWAYHPRARAPEARRRSCSRPRPSCRPLVTARRRTRTTERAGARRPTVAR